MPDNPDPVSDEIQDDGQLTLFEIPPAWQEAWERMPEFHQRDLEPYDSINVQFRNKADKVAFLTLLGEHVDRRQSIWFPRMEALNISIRSHPVMHVVPNRHPIYVISKGRWDRPLTARSLDQLSIPYSLVIEPQEYEHYSAVIDPDKILVLPFSNLGQGSIPARNWVWEHSIERGAARHWILDDNLNGFYRLNNNLKIKVCDQNPFLDLEVFCDRYTNIALAGLNYEFFAKRRSVTPPLLLNTRIYSCILINNAIPYRWRGRYNEDTDISIRVLKDGWCTVLFNAFLAKKVQTMTMKGGNTDELYQGDGRLKMAESLRDQHPDIVKITRKFKRWQHHVDYSQFKKNKLILRSDAPPSADLPMYLREESDRNDEAVGD